MAELVFGNVKHPPYIDRLIPDNETGAWDALGPLSQDGICQHTMVGSLWGTDTYFRPGNVRERGLTHYGIGGVTDGPAWDGVILRWNDPTGAAHDVDYSGPQKNADGTLVRHHGHVSANRAGWANGGTDGLEGDGPAFVAKYGANGVNTRLISIERSDGANSYGEPPSAKYIESFCQLVAYWADQDGIPWDKFPIRPKTGLTFYYQHFEFATKGCPHAPIISKTDVFMSRIREILKAAQGVAAPVYPLPYGWPAYDGYDHDAFIACKRFVTVKRGGGAECYRRASRETPKTRENIPVGSDVPVIYIVKDKATGSKWYVHEEGHRMPQSHFEETFTYSGW